VGFSSRKATSKKNDATRQPPLSAWLHLAHHSPCYQKICSNRSSRSMVRQAHHDRLDHPLVPSIKLRTGSELCRRMRSVQTVKHQSRFQTFHSRVPIVPNVRGIKTKEGRTSTFREFSKHRNEPYSVKVSGVWRRCHRRCLLTGVKKGRWSEAIAVGSFAFVEKIKGELGSKAMHREVEVFEGTHVLREESEVYGFKSAGEKESLSPENTVFWNESFEDGRT
jgi:hypothetical protein